MAFGFHGFEIGKQLGAAMGKPIDLTPSTNFLLRLAEQQKGEHLRMLQMTQKEMMSYNPKGLYQRDIPEFYDKYNKYKELLISHPGILFNPAKYSRQQYEQVQGARNDLITTMVNSIDRNKQQGQIMRQIVIGNQRGNYLNPGAADYWNSIKDKPTSELGGQGIDEDRIFSNPYSFSRQMQVYKAMAGKVTMKPLHVSDKNDPLLEHIYSVPEEGYGKVSSNAATLYDTVMPENMREGFQQQYESLSDNEKKSLLAGVKDGLAPIADQDPGAKEIIQDMQLNNGRDLFVLHEISDILPKEPIANAVNPVETKKIQIQQANQRLGLSEKHFQDRYMLSLGKDEQQKFKNYISEINSEVNSVVHEKYKGTTVPTDDEIKATRAAVTDAVNARRIKSGQYVPPPEQQAAVQQNNTEQKIKKDPFAPQ